MYIANRTFTSVHKHDYTKGQRISNARYFFLVDADKTSFDFYPHGKYDDDQEVDPNYGHSVEEYYYPATDIATGVVVGLVEEALLSDPVVANTFTPDQQPEPSFQGFDGGSGGGAGAGGSWPAQPDSLVDNKYADSIPDSAGDAEPTAYEPAPDPTPDSTPDTSYDSSSSDSGGGDN